MLHIMGMGHYYYTMVLLLIGMNVGYKYKRWLQYVMVNAYTFGIIYDWHCMVVSDKIYKAYVGLRVVGR
jgi:hypothetical protein